MTNTGIGAGELLYFTSGEYSDYCVMICVIARKEFDLEEAAQLFRAEWKWPEGDWRDEDEEPPKYAFINWLCANEYVNVATAREIHLGSYGELDFGKAGLDD